MVNIKALFTSKCAQNFSCFSLSYHRFKRVPVQIALCAISRFTEVAD